MAAPSLRSYWRSMASQSEVRPWYPTHTHRHRVLVASDDEKLLEMLTRGLNRHELEVVSVALSSDFAGLRSSADGEPPSIDVVLLDLPAGALAVLAAVAGRLRARKIGVPLVCLVGPGETAAVLRARSLGVSSVIARPIDVSELASELKSACAAGSSPDQRQRVP